MSGLLEQWVPGFDPATGMLVMPFWAAGALAALLVVFCLLAYSRAGREGMTGALARVMLVLIGVGAAWAVLQHSSGRDGVARRALDTRMTDLAMRSLAPGSALACLDATAGETVEAACEKVLFATPEATAAAVSYVAAQLALLADGADYARRTDPNYETALGELRRAAEIDRFGIVAHVLTVRDNCTPEACRAFALLSDPGHVSTNLAEHTYDFFVVRHAAAWPAAASAPTAALGLAPGGARVPGNLYLPSAASIPAVSIMNAEPAVQQAAADPTPRPKPVTRKPVASQQARRPTNLTPPSAAPPEITDQ